MIKLPKDQAIARWERVKALYCAGVPIKDICKREGGTDRSIYVKAHKERWPSPRRIRKELPPEAREPTPGELRKREEIRKNDLLIKHSAEVLRDKGEQGTSKAVDVLYDLLKKLKPEQIEQIADVQTLATAINALRKATGLDKAEQNAAVSVSVALFGQSGQPSFRIIED